MRPTSPAGRPLHGKNNPARSAAQNSKGHLACILRALQAYRPILGTMHRSHRLLSAVRISLVPALLLLLGLFPVTGDTSPPQEAFVQILFWNGQQGLFHEDEEGNGGLRPVADWTASHQEPCNPPASSATDCNLSIHSGNLTGASALPAFREAMHDLRHEDWPGLFLLSRIEHKLLAAWGDAGKPAKPVPARRQRPAKGKPPAAAPQGLQKTRPTPSPAPARREEDQDLRDWALKRTIEPGVVSRRTMGELTIAILGFDDCAAVTTNALSRMGQADFYVVLLPDRSCLGRPSVQHRFHALLPVPPENRTIVLYPASSNQFSRDPSGIYSCGSLPRQSCRLRLHFSGHNLRSVENSFETFREEERNHPLPPRRLHTRPDAQTEPPQPR